MAAYIGHLECVSSIELPSLDDGLNLPPPYRLLSLRESGDAFTHACANASALGAGTLVWTRRFDLAEFAVVLEPNESLRTAREVFLLGMSALIEALAAVSPPQMPISLDWPDTIRVDGVLVGGGRLGWPDGASEEQVPDWLVFAVMIRTALLQAADPGLRPLNGALEELGFTGLDTGMFLESFARHLLADLHTLAENGIGAIQQQYRMHQIAGQPESLNLDHLQNWLKKPSWLDPATGMPWL
jgi:biotin/lipoate A/B protein ligase family protein